MNEADNMLLRNDASLSELVSRVLDRGALISGEVIIGVAGVDLIYLGLQLAVSSVESMEERGRLREARTATARLAPESGSTGGAPGRDDHGGGASSV